MIEVQAGSSPSAGAATGRQRGVLEPVGELGMEAELGRGRASKRARRDWFSRLSPAIIVDQELFMTATMVTITLWY